MTAEEELQAHFQRLAKIPATVFLAEVLAVDKTANTVKVKDDLGIEYTEVRLNAMAKSGDSLIVYPEIGSQIMVSMINGQEDILLVMAASKVEEVKGIIGDLEFHITKKGYQITRSGENLGEVISDFIDEVSQVVVSIGVTPNVGALTKIKQRLKTILI